MRYRVIGGVLAIAIATHLALSAGSFCSQRLRTLSDEELIDAAITSQVRLVSGSDPQKAASIERRLRSNTNCCWVRRGFNIEASPDTALSKIARIAIGCNVATVSLDSAGPLQGSRYADPTYVVVTPCGQALN